MCTNAWQSDQPPGISPRATATACCEGGEHQFHYEYIYIHKCILKTLRVTAVSKGAGMIFEQGGNQGIGSNHQDPSGNPRFTRLGGSQRTLWGLLGGPQGPLRYRCWGQRLLTPAPVEIC